MKFFLMVCMVGFIFVIHISNVSAQTTSSVCLNKTADESQCKNCCDCLDVDAATRRSCRDACAVHDFSLNTDVITVDAPSVLGPDGDYSAALDTGSEQVCKEYCDGSDELACGDRHYCRDVCNAASFMNSSTDNSQKSVNSGLPPEIVEACQGKREQAVCQIGATFTGTCHTLQNQRACVVSQEEAPADVKQQWDSLDRNRDGFLDVNEINGDAGPRDQASGGNRPQENSRNEGSRPDEQQGGQGSGYSVEQAVSDPDNSQKPVNSGLPPEIVEACQGKHEQAVCQVGATFTGTCHTLQNQRACVVSQEEAPADVKQQWDSLDRNRDGFLDVNEINGDAGPRDQASGGKRPQENSRNEGRRPDKQQGGQGGGYSVEQAVSDRAQLTTIAFAGLAYLTGDLCGDTFLPPGKVSDFFGFQYLRDTDSGALGHNTAFVPRSANNMLSILNDTQKATLIALAKEQVSQIHKFGYQRFPLMKAFRRQLEGDIPAGSDGLNKQSVIEYSAELYRLDGQLSFQRAQVLGSIIRSLGQEQRVSLDTMAAGSSLTWADLPDQVDKRRFSHEEHVAVMTYASEMFSWYAGSVEADTYFCPERHGMYFGAFYLKDIPAMGNPDYSISTQITGDSGAAFLRILNDSQREIITSLVNIQREALTEVVSTRRAISEKFRQFMRQKPVDEDTVLALSEKYGKLDGEISYYYATHFAKVYKTLSNTQKEQLMTLRNLDDFRCTGAFLYSRNIAMPEIINTDFLF